MKTCRKPYPSDVSDLAVDTLGHLLALHVTPGSVEDLGEVEKLAPTVQSVTGDSAKIAWVDQGYTGERAAPAGESADKLATYFSMGPKVRCSSRATNPNAPYPAHAHRSA